MQNMRPPLDRIQESLDEIPQPYPCIDRKDVEYLIRVARAAEAFHREPMVEEIGFDGEGTYGYKALNDSAHWKLGAALKGGK